MCVLYVSVYCYRLAEGQPRVLEQERGEIWNELMRDRETRESERKSTNIANHHLSVHMLGG